jgi:hypothetical protein
VPLLDQRERRRIGRDVGPAGGDGDEAVDRERVPVKPDVCAHIDTTQFQERKGSAGLLTSYSLPRKYE